MCVVATDAGLADGAIGVDGLKVGLIADLDGAADRPFRLLPYCPKPLCSDSLYGLLCGLIGQRLIRR